MSLIFIGMSGWTFEGWRGSFYPDGLKQKDELAYASRRVRSIEINGTFYSLLRPPVYQGWYEATAEDFIFSIKGPKYITHERRLKDFARPLANFFASGVLALREKLGPILWQFPPTMKFDRELFEAFFAALPRDAAAAAKIGTEHSDWLNGRTFLEGSASHKLRHAVEGRHPSFESPEFVALARQYGVAIVVGDTDGRWPYIEDVTSDFIYLRLHGDVSKHPEGYGKEALENWAQRFRIWSEGGQPEDAKLMIAGEPERKPRPVFAYFDNEAKETAALNALSISDHLTHLGLLPLRDLAAGRLVAAKKPASAAAKASKKKVESATEKSETTKAPRQKAKTAAKTAPVKKAPVKKKSPAKKAKTKAKAVVGARTRDKAETKVKARTKTKTKAKSKAKVKRSARSA